MPILACMPPSPVACIIAASCRATRQPGGNALTRLFRAEGGRHLVLARREENAAALLDDGARLCPDRIEVLGVLLRIRIVEEGERIDEFAGQDSQLSPAF